jgi:hypothetical protein
MTERQTSADMQLDSNSRIGPDLPCVSCGCNLGGVVSDGFCPNCGTSVERSARGDLLRYSDPAWVEVLSSGTTWTLAGILVGILAGVAAAVVQVAYSQPELGVLLTAVGGLVGLIGFWKLTTPEPGETAPTETTARDLTRYGSIAGYLLNLLYQWASVSYADLAGYVGLPAALLGLVTIVATFIYAGRMATRIPDDGLVRQTRRVMSGMITLTLLWVILDVLKEIAGSTPPATLTGGTPANPLTGFTPATGIMMGLGCFAGITALTLAVWNLALLARFRRAFIQAARQARATRAVHGAIPGTTETPSP